MWLRSFTSESNFFLNTLGGHAFLPFLSRSWGILGTEAFRPARNFRYETYLSRYKARHSVRFCRGHAHRS